MNIEDLKEALGNEGIDYRESSNSLSVEYCPECSRKKYKVLFNLNVDDGNFLYGRCFSGSCGKTYSTLSYLTAIGVEYEDALSVHGMNPERAIRDLVPKTEPVIESVVTEERVEKPIDISRFLNISDYPEHPASKYAISRGYNKELSDAVKIDDVSCSVVFISYKDNKPVGYQMRYVVPTHRKTNTYEGFETSHNLIHFKNVGDIVISEGPFTGVSSWNWGFDSLVTFGSNISKYQLDMILNYSRKTNKKVYVARENDKAGYKYYESIYSFMQWNDVKVASIEPAFGCDLNESWVKGRGFSLIEREVITSIPDVSGLF